MLSRAEVSALFESCGEGWAGSRARALVAVLYRSGLRISEALALHPKDIDLDAGWVRVLNGKGGRSRTVGIDRAGGVHIAAWLERRAVLGVPAAAPVFAGLDGRALHPGSCRRMLARLGLEAGIQRRVHPHGLRHTHAAELRAEGIDIGIIARQLGHRSIATTARYLDHIAPVDVVEAIRGRGG